MNISAKSDYAVRAMLVLAATDGSRPVKGEALATSQQIPVKFLENILLDLRRAGLVASQRGAEGGYRLNRPAAEITVADVIRVVDGPIAAVAGVRPDEISYPPGAEALPGLWLEARGMLRSVLETVTFADLVKRSQAIAAGGERRTRRTPAARASLADS